MVHVWLTSFRAALLSFFCSVSLLANIPATERHALVTLYEAANGESWDRQQNWLGAPGTEAEWEGVVVENDHVVELNLGSNRLEGTLPPEIGNLTKLRRLDLRAGGSQPLYANPPVLFFLNGELPASLGNLQALEYLDLRGDRFEGVPDSLAGLTLLTTLLVGGNRFTRFPSLAGLSSLEVLDLSSLPVGAIPDLSLLISLRDLEVSRNHLSSIPWVGALIHLERLDLSGNELEELPPDFAGLTQLRELQLGGNRLQSLSPEIGQLANLDELSLDSNLLSSLPGEIGQLLSLESLDLSGNQLDTLPIQFGELAALKWLNLQSNPFTVFPAALAGLPQLDTLYSSDCQIQEIPPAIGAISSLRILALSSNDLHGSIPDEIGDLEQLEVLDITRNEDLAGEIPSSIGRLHHLRVLSLRDTALGGPIPDEIAGLLALQELDLQRTNITRLTPELGKLVNLRKLLLFSASVEGPIPHELGLLPNLSELDLRRNRLQGEIPVELSYLDHLRGGVSFNALYTHNEMLREFIDQQWEPNFPWEEAQTLPPDGFSVTRLDHETIRFDWIPLEIYEPNGKIDGYYEIFSGPTPEGPFQELVLSTQSLDEFSALHRQEESPKPVFFQIRSVTKPHHFNKNTVVSGFSPGASESLLPLTRSYAPFRQALDVDFTGFALANAESQPAFVEVMAWRNDGAPLWSPHPQFRPPPLPFELMGGRQLARLGNELFEIDSSTELESWLEILSDQSQLAAMYLFGGPGKLDGSANLREDEIDGPLYFSRVFRSADAGNPFQIVTRISLFNPSHEPVDAKIEGFFSSDGLQQIGRLEIPPHGFVTSSADQLLPEAEFPEVPAYLRVTAMAGGLIGVAWMENADSLMVLGGARFDGFHDLYTAQIADDEMIDSSLELINTSPSERKLQLTARAHDGSRILGPIEMTLAGGESHEESTRILFGLSSQPDQDRFQGSLNVKVNGTGVIGDLLLMERTDRRFATALQLQGRSSRRIVFPQLAQTVGIFTGVALYSPANDALATLTVFADDGNPVDHIDIPLEAQESRALLLVDLFPSISGMRAGYLTIDSDQPLIAVEIFGADNLDFLATVPGWSRE